MKVFMNGSPGVMGVMKNDYLEKKPESAFCILMVAPRGGRCSKKAGENPPVGTDIPPT
jgi:hypothetical protein